MDRSYKCLVRQKIAEGRYNIQPLRDEDRYAIMEWRNEQRFHLRQRCVLTKQQQDLYFQNVVAQLFDNQTPDQLLFSYMEDDKCIGYGGLVHINWEDRHAEISFLTSASFESSFECHWINFLNLIEKVAFDELFLHKIFTYAYDLRPKLYPILEQAGYTSNRLKDHKFFEGQFVDVVIHSKIIDSLTFRMADVSDAEIYYEWVNEEEVRRQSFDTGRISLEDHLRWFKKTLIDPLVTMLVFEFKNRKVGQIRFQKVANDTAIVSISINKEERGKGLASRIIKMGTEFFMERYNGFTLQALIRKSNVGSIRSFEKAGFEFDCDLTYKGINSVRYTRK